MIINEYHTGKYVEGGDCDLVLGNTLEWVRKTTKACINISNPRGII
jgi:hypothetical protein